MVFGKRSIKSCFPWYFSHDNALYISDITAPYLYAGVSARNNLPEPSLFPPTLVERMSSLDIQLPPRIAQPVSFITVHFQKERTDSLRTRAFTLSRLDGAVSFGGVQSTNVNILTHRRLHVFKRSWLSPHRQRPPPSSPLRRFKIANILCIFFCMNILVLPFRLGC